MSTAIGVLLLVGLFLLFPFVKRERKSGGCATGRCWKKRLGFGCGGCPLGPGGSGESRRTGGSGGGEGASGAERPVQPG